MEKIYERIAELEREVADHDLRLLVLRKGLGDCDISLMQLRDRIGEIEEKFDSLAAYNLAELRDRLKKINDNLSTFGIPRKEEDP